MQRLNFPTLFRTLSLSNQLPGEAGISARQRELEQSKVYVASWSASFTSTIDLCLTYNADHFTFVHMMQWQPTPRGFAGSVCADRHVCRKR